MNVYPTTTVMEMLTASIPLEVTTAAVTLAMRGMDSTAQVIHLYIQLAKTCKYHNWMHINLAVQV